MRDRQYKNAAFYIVSDGSYALRRPSVSDAKGAPSSSVPRPSFYVIVTKHSAIHILAGMFINNSIHQLSKRHEKDKEKRLQLGKATYAST